MIGVASVVVLSVETENIPRSRFRGSPVARNLHERLFRRELLRNWLRARRLPTRQLLLYVATFTAVVWVQKPSRFSFFGDSWDVLYLYLIDPRVILQPHNEHFIPIFKFLYFIQYKVFGAHHLGYMLVLYALHAFAAVLIYRIATQMQLSETAAIAAALIFAFDSAAWEVTGWSFEQQFALGVVFSLATLDVFLRGAPNRRALVWVAVLSLIGYWAGGPIGLVMALAIPAYWVILAIAGDEVTWESVPSVLLALWLPAAFYYVTVRLSVHFTSKLAFHPIAYPKIHLHLRDLSPMLDFSFFGTAWGIILPSLTFIHSQQTSSATVILIIVAAVAAISYRELSPRERTWFWLLVFIMSGAYMVISIGRLQYGVPAAAASRYQYLSAAPFALLLVLCWKGLRRYFAKDAQPLWWRAVSLGLLGYFLAFHCKTTRVENIDADRGIKVQRFLQAARKATFPANMPATAFALGASFPVPPYVIPPHRPLWMILQVIEGNRHTVVPEDPYLENWQGLQPYNILQNPGFETGMREEQWRTFGDAQFARTPAAAHSGRFGVGVIFARHAAAFSTNVINSCPSDLSGKMFTMAAEARTNVSGALVARALFKNQAGTILEVNSSDPHPGNAQWHELVTGGVAPEGTCVISIDFSDEGNVGIVASIDDIAVLLHPGFLAATGNPVFQSPQSLPQPPRTESRSVP